MVLNTGYAMESSREHLKIQMAVPHPGAGAHRPFWSVDWGQKVFKAPEVILRHKSG